MDNDLTPMYNQFRFVHYTDHDCRTLFHGQKVFYPFTADEVFAELMRRKNDKAMLSKLAKNVLFEAGIVVAIDQAGESTVLAQLDIRHPSMILGKSCTLRTLGINTLSQDENLLTNYISVLKCLLIRFLI